MNVINAAYEVLRKANEPLHYLEITRRALYQGLWQSSGATPEATLNARLSTDIKLNGVESRFQRTSPGVFALREWGVEEFTHALGKKQNVAHAKSKKAMSFTDAAEDVLGKFGDKRPMHYREITEKALELGLLNTAGKTPEATMYAQLLTETKRRKKRGENPRFAMHGKGYVGLTKWMGRGLAFQIEQHNRNVRKKLHARIRNLTPDQFEELIGTLLAAIGFEEVTVKVRGSVPARVSYLAVLQRGYLE